MEKFLETVEAKAASHNYSVMVLVPQFIPKKLAQHSSQSVRAFAAAEAPVEKDIVVATLPYHLKVKTCRGMPLQAVFGGYAAKRFSRNGRRYGKTKEDVIWQTKPQEK